MTRLALALTLGVFSLPTLTTSTLASGAIGRACMASERGAADAVLCGCIQAVADQVLSPAEQQRGAQLFLAPHKAQEIRASERQSDTHFWEKWQIMAEGAAASCQ